jgi:hypothetical protein
MNSKLIHLPQTEFSQQWLHKIVKFKDSKAEFVVTSAVENGYKVTLKCDCCEEVEEVDCGIFAIRNLNDNDDWRVFRPFTEMPKDWKLPNPQNWDFLNNLEILRDGQEYCQNTIIQEILIDFYSEDENFTYANLHWINPSSKTTKYKFPKTEWIGNAKPRSKKYVFVYGSFTTIRDNKYLSKGFNMSKEVNPEELENFLQDIREIIKTNLNIQPDRIISGPFPFPENLDESTKES